ncbi:isoamyl acetate-hydrolyzing esterase [Coemansia sp. BCRC 34301]|nr:isoamyl acetate-hydrolyzing esterase [Coemansia sp. BCRC 34301]
MSSQASPLVYGSILCFGDSLTQHGYDVSKRGWVAQLSSSYIRKFDVISRGFGGYTSRWILPLLPSILSQTKPRLLTILVGSNDAFLLPHPRHVPLTEYKENIERLVDIVRTQSPGTKIILITPPSLGEKLFMTCNEYLGRTHESVKACADVMRRVASEQSLPCADLWAAVEAKAKEIGGDLDGYDAFCHDGVHLNAGGNQLLFEVVMQTIKQHYPELDPDSIPFVVASQKDVSEALADGADVETAVLNTKKL